MRWPPLLALLLLLAGAPKPHPATHGEPGCQDSLWHHIYRPSRLVVLRECVTVTGTVVDATHGRRSDGVRHEADGDTHGWLRLDAGQDSLLDAGNRRDESGNLVFEIPCEFHVRQRDAIAACRGWREPLSVPPVGAHVRMTGTLVRDTNHGRWNELHPVAEWQTIP